MRTNSMRAVPLSIGAAPGPVADGDEDALRLQPSEPRHPVALFAGPSGTRAVAIDTDAGGTELPRALAGERLVGVLPPLYPEWLGDRGFARAHGVRFPYVVGEMARGIATPEMVIAAVQAGLCAFFGSAGLPVGEIAAAVDVIEARLGPSRAGWGANLIHSPNEPAAEMAFAHLALQRRLPAVSASAFMRLGPAVVLLSARGLSRALDGRIVRARSIFAKVSRAEVARQFLSPAPEALLSGLVAQGLLAPDEAELARRIPVAGDITVEADSGGHTDNRPLGVLLPEMLDLARRIAAERGYAEVPRVGAAGGLGTPAAVAAAFAAGAAYVVTGSINQCATQSGLSADGRRLLADAGPADVAMAPAADMFELGVKVQVLRRGTLFAQRGARLHDAYRRYDSLDAIPAGEREEIERGVLGRPIDDVWAETRAHFAASAPAELERAERDARHKMALVFRWYLFMGAKWARDGEQARRADYQIWCGPAMGAFNRWVEGSFLAPPESRDVAQIARNLLEGAAHVARAQALRQAGVALPPGAFDFRPRPLA